MDFGFDSISIRFGHKEVLNDFSLAVPRGRIVTIVGQNGCGKSSLLKTVSKTVRPVGGRVYLDGKPLNAYSPRHLARRIAYLPQVHTSPPDIDVYTLVSYGRYPHSRFGRRLDRRDREKIEAAIRLTGLTELQQREVGTLSGGERQRARIAMTICQEPEILIMDEPTTYLDIGYQIEVLELVRRLNSELNLTILMVLHDLNMAARYSDSICAIKDGRCHICGPVAEVITAQNLLDVFCIRANVFKDCENNCPYFIP